MHFIADAIWIIKNKQAEKQNRQRSEDHLRQLEIEELQRKLHRADQQNGEQDMINQMDGGRPLPLDRDTLGRLVREAWVRWAQTQSNPKPTWLVPYEQLEECDKEADRQIGEAIARWTLIADAASASFQAVT